MSTAHRPTWAPAQARQTGSGSKQVSVKDVAGNTKLKFRQPGQGTTSEISRRDLKLELAKAEENARNKRKGISTNDDEIAGVPKVGLVAGASVGATQQVEDEQAAKRRKLIEQAAALDRDDSDEEEEDELELGTSGDAKVNGNGKGKEKAVETPDQDDGDEEEEEEDSEDEEDDEDETAELLRELEKIKRERAEEKARNESERASSAAISAEEAAAMGNPLLNLQAALSGNKVFDSPGGYSSSASATGTAASFQIKKRWDDDVIFKNQAVGSEVSKKEFINDGIRSSFHRRFMSKYIA